MVKNWGYSATFLLNREWLWHQVADEFIDEPLVLNKGYIPTRYPNANPSGSIMSRYALYIMEEVMRFTIHAEKTIEFWSYFCSKFKKEEILRVFSKRLQELEEKLTSII